MNQMIAIASAGSGLWYAVTGRTMALRVFVGIAAGGAALALANR